MVRNVDSFSRPGSTAGWVGMFWTTIRMLRCGTIVEGVLWALERRSSSQDSYSGGREKEVLIQHLIEGWEQLHLSVATRGIL